MYTNNYDFQNTNVIKIILRNKDNKVLLIQEPADNNWMPLHWGLPGGKPTETESLLETFNRKTKTDIGQEVRPDGMIRAYELLMNGRTIIMYIVLANATSDTVSGEAKEYKWMTKDEIKEMETNEFTEFYNKKLLIDYFDGNYELLPLDLFETLEYYKMDKDIEYKSWLKSGSGK